MFVEWTLDRRILVIEDDEELAKLKELTGCIQSLLRSPGSGIRARGTRLFNSGRFDAALAVFERGLRETRAPDLAVMAAHCLRALGRVRQARGRFLAALRGDPGCAQAALGLAGMLRSEGDLPGAIAALRRAQARAPRHVLLRRALAGLLRERALAAQAAGSDAEALAAWASLLRVEPVHREARRELGGILLKLAQKARTEGRLEGTRRRWLRALDFPAAERALRRAEAALDSGSRQEPPARGPEAAGERMAAWSRAAEACWRQRRPEEAARVWESALSRLAPAERLDRFRALAGAGRFEEAFALGEALLPDLGTRGLWVLIDPWTAGLAEAAGPAYRSSLTRLIKRGAGEPWARYYRAQLAPEEAAAGGDFTALEALTGGRYGWMIQRAGRFRLASRDYARAAALLARAARQTPADWRSLGFRAEALLCLNRRPQALACMRRARRLAPEADKPDAWAWEGALELWAGRFRRALRILDQAFGRGARWALCWRAGARICLGAPAEALPDLDRAQALHPGDREAAVWRGEALRLSGRARACQRLLSRSQESLWSLANLALARLDLGDRAGAEADWSRARALAQLPEGGELRARLEGLLRGHGYRGESPYLEAVWRPLVAPPR